MKIRNIIKKKIILNLGYIIIIGGIIISEKVKSGAPWLSIIQSEFINILFIIIVAVIVELILRIIKSD